ncbi:DUF3445 domain-containing protein [Opitutaceae bacterium]|nr:DUF3445 domain-containing protein [Opitutaceae bacterium]MDB4473464.1 DUF3445 domain-containing protein [Opitutaceae bacterium]
MNDWSDLFPEDDFGFRLTLRRGDPGEFFKPTPDAKEILAERKKALEETPENYAIIAPEGRDAWSEFVRTTRDWVGSEVSADPIVAGAQLEPDVVLLCRDKTGVFRVAGGVVVFPSHWALPEKIGLTLLEVHGVVPGLNAAIGPAINRYLDKIKPGFSAGRPNWGLAATDAWNLHPAIKPPPLMTGTPPDKIWVRVERQILTPLPETGAMLFGIRIERIRLDEVLAAPDTKRRFHRTIATMPAAVATYKGLSAVLPDLLRFSQ